MPRWWAFIAGAALVSVSWAVESTRAGLATLLYTFTIVAMFAVSGTYHRVNWRSENARNGWKRLDHSMIFVFIAGSYTPFALLALPSEKGWVAVLDSSVGRGDRGRAAQDVLAVGAALGGRAAVPSARLGSGLVRWADHGGRWRRCVGVLMIVGGALYSIGGCCTR